VEPPKVMVGLKVSGIDADAAVGTTDREESAMVLGGRVSFA
jgi:hypothetical protein